MKTHPKEYTKKNFIKFLNKNNINNNIAKRFNQLPETVYINDSNYDIYINVTWYPEDETRYKFELNYYSKTKIEFLFSYNIFKNIEHSITNLLADLVRTDLIKNVDE